MDSPLNHLNAVDLLTNGLDIFNGSVEPTQNISQEIPFNENEINQIFSPAQNSPSSHEQLQFAAEPNDSFRFRYESEINRLNQYQRYLRTKSGSSKYTHPTIKVFERERERKKYLCHCLFLIDSTKMVRCLSWILHSS